MRILRRCALLLALALCLTGCGGEKEQGVPDQSAFTWKFEISQAVWSDGLHTVRQSTQYDGTVIETEYEKMPEAGQALLLVELRVYKDQAGGQAFSWEDVALEGEDGDTYTRLPDSFLMEFGYDRLPGTELRLKENRGWICFQLPEAAEGMEWTLTHRSEEGVNAIGIPEGKDVA